MQLGFSFSLLLATLVLAMSSVVEAAPTVKRSSGMITLPLKRIAQNRDDVHPLVLLQQHINRGLKRGARMAGREAPSDLELRENLHKRMFIPRSWQETQPWQALQPKWR
ncbi:hypothetical protein QCA50_005721 [Cerrena zonata]|uniref:Uncharacterized protein n=1 Tax=Cerrena zonata TaxID=2478898 RepID=A0AAW0GDW5_9APHY